MNEPRPTGSAPAAPREIPTGYTATDWPCKKCRSTHVAERCDESSDGAYEDYHFMCLDCGHSWWEESSDY